jgi:hypothetical protein
MDTGKGSVNQGGTAGVEFVFPVLDRLYKKFVRGVFFYPKFINRRR